MKDLMKCYTTYVNNYEASLEVLAKLSKKEEWIKFQNVFRIRFFAYLTGSESRSVVEQTGFTQLTNHSYSSTKISFFLYSNNFL
jgi:hypothetical protein